MESQWRDLPKSPASQIELRCSDLHLISGLQSKIQRFQFELTFKTKVSTFIFIDLYSCTGQFILREIFNKQISLDNSFDTIKYIFDYKNRLQF